MKKRGRYRIERDTLGEKKVPASVYYGIETQRALENFRVSELHLPMHLVKALALIKKAAAIANWQTQRLDNKRCHAIVKACDEIIAGKLDSEFPLDVFQAGAGTSEHMNVNEVIANRALEVLKRKKGDYNYLSPHDHVNLGQSTNDVFHSAIHIAAYTALLHHLLPALYDLEKKLTAKSHQWKNIKKSGRTHLRDAAPLSLGQEFGGYAALIAKSRRQIEHDAKILLSINIGGTAVGTGVTAPPTFTKIMLTTIRKLSRFPFKHEPNLFAGTQSLDSLAAVHSTFKTLATTLIKIANDLRLLGSGPTSGFDEIELPAVQPGSSIMPGKVNPSVAEMVDMVGFQVIGNDTTITLCAQAGQLELNVMMPLAAYCTLQSIEILSRCAFIFGGLCIEGMQAHDEKCREYLEKNPLLITALAPVLGYDNAAKIAQRAYKEGKTIKEIVLEDKLMDKKKFDAFLAGRKLI